MAAIAHAAGARVVVDAAQLAPHRRVDLAATGVDYVAFSGHKLYAPYGAGRADRPPRLARRRRPYLAGGGAVQDDLDDVTWAPAPPGTRRAHRTCWASPPSRRPAGRWRRPGRSGPGARAPAGRPARRRPGDDPRRDAAAAGPAARHRHVGVVNFSLEGYDAGLVAAYLSAEHGIGLRDGRFCAHPLLQRLCQNSGGRKARGPESGGQDSRGRRRRHRGPGQHRSGDDRRARRPPGRRAARAGHPRRPLDLRPRRRPLGAHAGPPRPRPAGRRRARDGRHRVRPPGLTARRQSLLVNGFMPLVDLSAAAAAWCVQRPSAAGAVPRCAGGPTAGS